MITLYLHKGHKKIAIFKFNIYFGTTFEFIF